MVLIFLVIIIIMIIIMMIRVRVPRTRVAALPTPSSLLVTPHPSAHLRALDQGDHDDDGVGDDRDDERDDDDGAVLIMMMIIQVSFNVRVPGPQFSAPDRSHLSSRPNQLQVAMMIIIA